MNNAQLFRAYNSNDELMVYAGHLAEDFGDGQFLVKTGSASLVASRIEPISVGDEFEHYLFGPVRIKKINRKTVKLQDLTNPDKSVPDMQV